MADQKIMGDLLASVKGSPIPPKPLAEIFRLQELFGSKFCDFKTLSKRNDLPSLIEWQKTFGDCIFDEMSEVLGWLDWKHWKKYEGFVLNKAEIRFELIDILHFVVSECLLFGITAEEPLDKPSSRYTADTDLDILVKASKGRFFDEGLDIDELGYGSRSSLLRRKLREMNLVVSALQNARQADIGRLVELLFDMFIIMDMTGPDIYLHYLAKNKENFDRQARGY